MQLEPTQPAASRRQLQHPDDFGDYQDRTTPTVESAAGPMQQLLGGPGGEPVLRHPDAHAHRPQLRESVLRRRLARDAAIERPV